MVPQRGSLAILDTTTNEENLMKRKARGVNKMANEMTNIDEEREMKKPKARQNDVAEEMTGDDSEEKMKNDEKEERHKGKAEEAKR